MPRIIGGVKPRPAGMAGEREPVTSTDPYPHSRCASPSRLIEEWMPWRRRCRRHQYRHRITVVLLAPVPIAPPSPSPRSAPLYPVARHLLNPDPSSPFTVNDACLSVVSVMNLIHSIRLVAVGS
jgi:hypothetical protein